MNHASTPASVAPRQRGSAMVEARLSKAAIAWMAAFIARQNTVDRLFETARARINIMKSAATTAIFILAAGLGSASAKLNIENISPQQTDRPYSQIILKDKKPYWLSAGQTDAAGAQGDFLVLQEMDCRANGKAKNINMPADYMALAPLAEFMWQKALVIGVNFSGEWSLTQLHDDLSGTQQSLPLSNVGAIWASTSSKAGYFIAGTSANKQPMLMYFSGDLKSKKALGQANDHHGEVSSVFESRGRVFALFNRYPGAKDTGTSPGAELREYSATGAPVSRTPLNGTAATGTALKDGGIAISYWIGKQLFMEKRAAHLATLWTAQLHQRSGIASMKGHLLEAGSDIAWIGANDNQLLVHRVTQDGASVQTSVDTQSKMGIPTPRIYSASSSGNDISIRGAAGRSANPRPGQVTRFCFTEKPDS
ncbi:hypothetical protein D5045_13935 [Verminephrobacter eiseniae]|uniref:hypothetical protein n=1 Tax=Verminephrobacter eiseniae TaxID=364317 RepID=UPI002237C28B|nr:hypothetical protein [Verminephrobacter eiseniae]MCW5261236.1 hypothetical protein [Verminephrobacter eiseniae]